MKQRIVFKVILIVVGIFWFTFNSFSRIKANQGGSEGFKNCPNPPCPSSTSSKSHAGSIEYYIITGANYFLKSHSDIQKFLSEVEIMDIEGKDFYKLNIVLDSAIRNMELAWVEYWKLKEKADNTPYNQDFISKLICFNYKEFEIRNSLNGDIFDAVSSYLCVGNICGLFDKSLMDVRDLIIKMREIKHYISFGIYPRNHLFWRLNQKFSESQLFGQYASEVFYEISGKY